MRQPWEIDWNDPRQVQQQTQRPTRIQGPPREPTPRYGDEAQRSVLGVRQAEQDLTISPQRERRDQMQAARVPDTMADDFTTAVDAFGGLARSVQRFNDDFSGFGSGIENTAQNYLGTGTPGQRDWWAEFYSAENIAKNRLLGASQSPQEQASYERTTVSPNTSPAQVRENLERRMELARGALRRRRDFLRAGGYNPAQIDAMLGEYAPMLETGGQERPEQAAPPSLGVPQPGQQPRETPTQFNQRAMPRGQEQAQLSTETDTGVNPALRGLNAQVGQMLQRRRPMREIINYVRERGATPQALQGIAADIRRIQAWQRQHPNYNGPIEADLERYEFQLDPIASTAASVASGPVGAAVGSYINDVTGQHLDNITNAVGGDGELLNQGLAQVRRDNPMSSLLGDVGAGASLYGAGRAVAGRALGGALPGAVGTFSPAAIGGDAALGAYIGSGSQGTDPFSLSGAGRGALAGAGGGMVGRGAINTVGRAVSPTGGRMAPLYQEGVQPTIGQRVGGAADRFEQAITSVPGVGAIPRRARNEAVEQFETGAFNQALREIGAQLPQNARFGTGAHNYMQRAFNVAFRRIRSRSQFVRDGDFDNDLVTIRSDVGLLDDASQSHFERIVANELEGRLTRTGGSLRGADYVKVASRLDRVARNLRRNPNADPSLAEAFDELSSAMDRAAARHSAPGLAESLAATRRGYQRAVVIEDAARRRGNGVGRFSPTQLDAAVQNIGGGLRSRAYLRGDAPMQEYATAGLNLGDTLANSGTVDRILASGAVGSAGYANPWLLAPMGANLALTAPGVRKGVNAALAPNRPGLRGLRSQIQDRAYLGPMFGYPLLGQQQ